MVGPAHLVLIAPLVAWVTLSVLAFLWVWRFQKGLGQPPVLRENPRVAVIMPVRGMPADLPELWNCLCGQSYRPWRLVFVVESTVDPGHAALSALAARPGAPPVEIVVAGPTVDTAQKVHNQLAALKRLGDEDEVVVFADADMTPPSDWLTRAVAKLANPDYALVSGYRWLFPADETLATALLCAVNSAVATMPRFRRMNLAWGGTMAMRRATLDALDPPSWLHGAVTEDLSLTRGIWARGSAVMCPRELMLPSPVALSWRAGFAFARRQYQIVRIYMPVHWWLAAAGTTLPLVGWAVALPLAFRGVPLAWAVILLVNLFDQGRGAMRRRIVRILWGEAGLAKLRRVLWLDRYATPACLLYHAAVIWSSGFGRTISWAQRVYRVEGPQRLTLVAAPDMPVDAVPRDDARSVAAARGGAAP